MMDMAGADSFNVVARLAGTGSDSFEPEDAEVARQTPFSAGQERKWSELPFDILSVIFRKLGAVEVIRGPQWVCRPWRELSWVPQTWRVVDMSMHCAAYSSDTDTSYLVKMAREVISRSNGLMEEFYAKNFGDDLLMMYIAERAQGLTSLGLIGCRDISDEALIDLAKRSPKLEHLEISLCSFSPQFVEALGPACPQLKSFRLSHEWKSFFTGRDALNDDLEAFGIANGMKGLRYLQVVGSKLSAEALHAILDNCPNLESLHIRRCYLLEVNRSLRQKCGRIRDLVLSGVSSTPHHDHESSNHSEAPLLLGREYSGRFKDMEPFLAMGVPFADSDSYCAYLDENATSTGSDVEDYYVPFL